MEFSRSLLRVENKQTGFRRTGFQVPTTGCTQLIHLILLHGEFSESKIQPSQNQWWVTKAYWIDTQRCQCRLRYIIKPIE